MVGDNDEVASLRLALADAQRSRDETLVALGSAEQRRHDERQEEMHRLRNLFSVIRIIARRTGDDARTVEDYCGLLDGRLASYLGVQAAVARDWQRGSDLALLVAGQLLTFGLKEGERVELAGPAINLTSRAAILLALAFHELATAAILSDRLEGEGSSLRVSWSFVKQGPDQGLSIDWVESFPDQDAGEEKRTSWVEWIEQAIAHQLAGTMIINDAEAGRSVTFRLPSSAVI